MKSFFIALTRNPVSLLGCTITTAAAMLIATLVIIQSIGGHGSPYIGILSYVILPAVFALGLALIPLGIYQERRRARRRASDGRVPPSFPIVDLNRPATRKVLMVFFTLTVANVIVLATATYKGVEVLDSNSFCGATCHAVMQPEYTAYARSPHARVKCVSCHIGPGADWFVKAKLSGAWQLVATSLDLYPRPIPTPIHNLRPARDTCEQCHWPTKFVGDRLKVITRHADDETNTQLKTVLLLRVGGVEGRKSHGIHWHVDPSLQIRYQADETRETIHRIELTLPDGTVRNYQRDSAPAAAESEWRVMDCVDCHNRPTHVYRLPAQEIDSAMEQGRLPRDLPYMRREAERALEAEYASHEEARDGIRAAVANFYQETYPEVAAQRARDIEQAGETLGQLYAFNVFPEMNVGWGTYPNHLGHESFPGCFRCHDDEIATAEGDVVSQDCDTCHTVLAWEEEDPEILESLQP